MHDARSRAGEFEHLVVADPVDLASLGHDARVGRVDAVHVGIDLAADLERAVAGPPVAGVVLHDGGEGNGSRVGATSTQGRDVEVLVHALEPGDDDDLTFLESAAHAFRADALDAGLGVRPVGDDADLRPGEADGALAECVDRHREERDRLLFARGEEHVHLAGGRGLADLLGQLDQFVGLVAARADDDENLVPLRLRADGPARRRLDALRVGDARPAELLNHDTQESLLEPVKKAGIRHR